jgi:hypothetical protein
MFYDQVGELTPHPIFFIVGQQSDAKGAMMRLDLGGSHIVLVWTEEQYRNEVARLFQGINSTTVKLVRARVFFGLRFVVLRRVKSARETASTRAVK